MSGLATPIDLLHPIVVQRARSALSAQISYGLGKGGMKPSNPLPSNGEGLCDCSGFAAWACGFSRETKNPFYVELNGGWFETTAIVADALKPGGMFVKVLVPQPGDLIVWGDRKVKNASGKLVTVQGHVGVISDVASEKANKVIHCSTGNQRKLGRAIAETGADIFHKNGAIYARRAS